MLETTTLLVERLRCVRGERELFSDLTFSVNAGMCLHVLGANGSGKSSLLRILCGLRRADEGEVYWQDQPIVGNTEFLATSGFIGHTDGLKSELTAIENLRWYQHLANQKGEDELDDCLEKLGILRCADLVTGQLSFGQRRRLAFARLLLAPQKLWILDEPFTGIDVNGRKTIESLCVAHLQAGGSIIMTHHQSLEGGALSAYRTELNLH
ncbi:cytochrome c biogenesis heme-transporting ATPase CcmA [Arenicella xantha]|nr:cytochrome c biogenesis heme-transporting ATPase CcmA [Arenicella xantha]